MTFAACAFLTCAVVEADYSEALGILFRYPNLPTEYPPWTLAKDAQHLQEHLNSESGAQLIERYTGRRPPVTPAAEGGARSNLPLNFMQSSSGLEALLQDTARKVYTRGEQWGVNKAVRDAVGEVQKGVRDLQVRGNQRLNSRAGSYAEQGSHDQLLRRVAALEKRNRSLAKMLEDSVNSLWEQRVVTTIEKAENEEQKDFNLAVGKVQFVQLCLEDSTIPLPSDLAQADTAKDAEPTESAKEETVPKHEALAPGPKVAASAPTKSPTESTETAPVQRPPVPKTSEHPPPPPQKDIPATVKEQSAPQLPSKPVPTSTPTTVDPTTAPIQEPTKQTTQPASTDSVPDTAPAPSLASAPAPAPETPHRPRTLLAKSEHSFLLGEDDTSSRSAFLSGSPHSTPSRFEKNKRTHISCISLRRRGRRKRRKEGPGRPIRLNEMDK